MSSPTELGFGSRGYGEGKQQCSCAGVEMISSTGKRDFCIRKLSLMLSFDKDTSSQDVGKDSNSVPVHYFPTGLCGPLQLQIFLPCYIEQVAPEQIITWSIAMEKNGGKITSFILHLF